MAWTPVKIDASIANTESRAAVQVPEGDYLLEFTGVKASKEDAAKAHVILRGKIVEGPAGIGQTLPTWCYFSEGAQFRLGQAYEALGGEPSKLVGREFPTYKHFTAFAASLEKNMVGKRVVATIGDEEYDGKTRSRVAAFLPASEWEARKGFQSNATPAEAPAAAEGEDLEDLLGGEITL